MHFIGAAVRFIHLIDYHDRVQVKVVLRGGAAEKAGFAANDEWIGIELPAGKGHAAQAWRIAKLDDLALYLGPATKCTALVARDRRLLRLPLVLPQDVKTARLVLQDAAKVSAWLAMSAPRLATSCASPPPAGISANII